VGRVLSVVKDQPKILEIWPLFPCRSGLLAAINRKRELAPTVEGNGEGDCGMNEKEILQQMEIADEFS
jgi:hypothetical protein